MSSLWDRRINRKSQFKKDGILYQQKFKLRKPSASRFKVGQWIVKPAKDGDVVTPLVLPRLGLPVSLPVAGPAVDRRSRPCATARRSKAPGLWSLPDTVGHGSGLAQMRTCESHTVSCAANSIMVTNRCALQIEKPQLIEEGG